MFHHVDQHLLFLIYLYFLYIEAGLGFIINVRQRRNLLLDVFSVFIVFRSEWRDEAMLLNELSVDGNISAVVGARSCRGR
jgi:hypothetical protein